MSARVILIADDDSTDVFFLTNALKESCTPVTITTVSDGEQAIDYLAGSGKYSDRAAYPFPTHMFLDLKMPRRSGLEVLQWLRRQKEVGLLPVTVLSGSQLAQDMESVKALGADYAVKPVEYAALLDLVRGFCRKFSV